MIDDRDGGDSREAQPVDLSPIDPRHDDTRFAALAQAIVRDGMAARQRRARFEHESGAMAYVWRWSTPILAAAAVIIVAAIPTLTRPVGGRSGDGASVGSTASAGPPATAASPDGFASADRLGVPASIVALVQSRRDPTPAEVVAAFDARWRGAGQ
jgi:hypothetical protein